MRIFVTGGSGFIGSHFIDLALSEGHHVVSCSDLSDRQSHANLNCLGKRLLDIGKEDLAGCEVVAHFAAAGVTPKECSWLEAFEVNVTQSLRLLMLATDSKIERVVVAGSYAEYGKAGLRYGKIPANAPLEPTDPYAASKAAASIAMAAYARNMKTQLFYGRIFSAYGERQYEKNFWQQLRHAAINGNDFDMTLGEQIRDFIHVECVAKIFLRSCCQTEIINGDPLITNIASGNPISLADFAREWWGKFNAKGALNIGSLPYRENEVMTYVAEVDPSI